MAANGIRAGTIKADQWGDAREQLGRAEGITSQPVQLSGGSKGTLTAAKFPHRTIFHFDAAGQMQGRTYDECEMIWGVHYAPEMSGKPSVRMDVVPVVRSLRRQMRLSRTGQELGIDYIQPEVAYDLGIHTVLPIGSAIAIGTDRRRGQFGNFYRARIHGGRHARGSHRAADHDVSSAVQTRREAASKRNR